VPNDFSFAPHENDPTDIAKNPWKHHASAAAAGGATGAAIGTALGAWAGAGKGFKSMLGHAGAGALFGGGLGTGLGYHKSEKKQRTVEQAYGANDPFAMDKLSYDQAHDAGRQFAWRMLREKLAHLGPLAPLGLLDGSLQAPALPQVPRGSTFNPRDFDFDGLLVPMKQTPGGRVRNELPIASDWASVQRGGRGKPRVVTVHPKLLVSPERALALKHQVTRNSTTGGDALAMEHAANVALVEEHNRNVLNAHFAGHPHRAHLVDYVLQKHRENHQDYFDFDRFEGNVRRVAPEPPRSQTAARTSGAPSGTPAQVSPAAAASASTTSAAGAATSTPHASSGAASSAASSAAGAPTAQATGAPTAQATGAPTAQATGAPTAQATGAPTAQATGAPTAQATGAPTAQATGAASTTHGSNRQPRSVAPPQQTLSEAATDLWTNHKGKLGLGAAALGLSGLGYYAYMQNERRNADQLFQPREDVMGA
jgi:hypothetical protein